MEHKGKGILLLHDIHQRTVDALPSNLAELKTAAFASSMWYRPAPDRPATRPSRSNGNYIRRQKTSRSPHWPKVPDFVFANADQLAAPAFSYFDVSGVKLLLSTEMFAERPARGVPLPETAPWPRNLPVPAADAATTTLAIPGRNVFELPDLPRLAAESAALRAPEPARRMAVRGEPEGSITAVGVKHSIRGKFHSGHGKQLVLSRHGGGGTRTAHRRSNAAHAHRGPARHLAQVRKRSA